MKVNMVITFNTLTNEKNNYIDYENRCARRRCGRLRTLQLSKSLPKYNNYKIYRYLINNILPIIRHSIEHTMCINL